MQIEDDNHCKKLEENSLKQSALMLQLLSEIVISIFFFFLGPSKCK